MRFFVVKCNFPVVNCILDNTPPNNDHFDMALYNAAAIGDVHEIRKIIADHRGHISVDCFHRAVVSAAKNGHVPVIKAIVAAGIEVSENT